MYPLFNSICFTKKFMAACAVLTCANTAFAHTVVENCSAKTGSVHKAVSQAGHGCAGLVTIAEKMATGTATSAERQSAPASALVQITNAWVRATVPGQKGSGAFMTLTAKTGTRLVGAASPVAGVAEVHEMEMEGNIMRMRAVTSLDLPAGKAIEFKPGGLHLMLMDLKQTLSAGSTVPVTLQLQDAKGVKSMLEVKLPVSLVAPGAAAAGKAASASAAMDHSKH